MEFRLPRHFEKKEEDQLGLANLLAREHGIDVSLQARMMEVEKNGHHNFDVEK